MTRVKICGITRDEDAALAIQLGAAALGFNFYAASPRYVEPAKARRIIRKLPPFVVPVGVFADEDDESRIVSAAVEAGVAAVQFHGMMPSRNGNALAGFKIIRALAVRSGFDPECIKSIIADAILLDGCHPVLKGGTGNTVDWKIARAAAKQGKVIILAGGLTPDNVGEAVRAVRPFAVDVASGVESSPGFKDAGKMRAFFTAVAAAGE